MFSDYSNFFLWDDVSVCFQNYTTIEETFPDDYYIEGYSYYNINYKCSTKKTVEKAFTIGHFVAGCILMAFTMINFIATQTCSKYSCYVETQVGFGEAISGCIYACCQKIDDIFNG